MKKSILALSIGAAVSYGAQANIIISETTESSGFNKAIEIANTGTDTIPLTGYSLVKASNGGGSWGEPIDLSAYTLAPNETLVIVHNSTQEGKISDELLAAADIRDGSVANFNGDDALALLKNGVEHDVMGKKDVQENYNKDVTLRRVDTTPSAVYDASKFSTHDGSDHSNFGKFSNEPTPPPVATPSTIQEIQGQSWSSTIDGIDVPNKVYESASYHEVTGVVTAIQKTALGSDLKVGFFMQAPSDSDALTSDGIFVETSNISDLSVGSAVTVVAKVKEDYGWTKLVKVDSVKVTGSETAPAATTLRVLDSDKEDFDFTLERHEGMLIQFNKDSDMRVSRTFGFDYGPKRNNMVVSNGQVNLHPNQNNAPVVHDRTIDTAPERQTDCNKDKRIIVESFEAVTKGTHIPWYPDFGKESAVPMPDGSTTSDDYVRIGDVLDGFEGVVSYSYGEYRFYVTNTVTKDNFARESSERTQAPVLKEGGNLRVATFNVLNYFNSPFGGDCNPTDPSDRDSVSGGSCSNRGAASEQEFQLQGDKIARAIIAVNADIVGLMEIENNGFGEKSAVAHLVAKINNLIDDEKDHYSYVADKDGSQYVGSDAIASQVIFKESKVSLDTYRLIEMPEQHAPKTDGESGDNYQRDTITPTFKINGTEEKITVAVNHLKSKGSKCWEDAAPVAEGGQAGKDPDKQGSCENFRVSAAFHLGQELSKIDGSKLILGDLNSYGNEDPIMVLTNRDNAPQDHVIKSARNTYIGGDKDVLGTPLHGDEGAVITDSYGYVNIVRQLHPDSYSYSYNDEVGTLDYILVTPELVGKVIDATDWNINAGESTLFQYADKNNCLDGECSTRFKDMYRASDHDPAIVVLNFDGSVVPPLDPCDDPNDDSCVPWTPIGPSDPIDPLDPCDDPNDDSCVPWTPIGPSDPIDPTEPPVEITPPSNPVNPPADLPEIPSAPVVGEPIKVMFDLTNINGTQLHAGDKAVLNIAKISAFKAAVAGADTNTVILTKAIIEQGWVELEGDISEAGEFKMTKQIIDGVTGLPTYTSPAETIKVAEKNDDKTQPVDSNPGHSHGGSTGLFGLLSLLGLGFFRRKMNK
ncbi:ExeM/NucH family extracellular endonuclease [Photobacterium chitinilyticum]|uniref:ExeM/NucH family extracellular endonuclease n=1 Tax=Photobacterium chitinilyticum TaxID=2485123 RepID=A0A444JSE1_9GAMM|nr:ExeM/NucH family extracellular endonuclease [Photobacterium chitinilyticum]RWX56035.1 ExeM/NucH family extracellular endonuclease [Photobacterium chitinilyticum]